MVSCGLNSEGKVPFPNKHLCDALSNKQLEKKRHYKGVDVSHIGPWADSTDRSLPSRPLEKTLHRPAVSSAVGCSALSDVSGMGMDHKRFF